MNQSPVLLAAVAAVVGAITGYLNGGLVPAAILAVTSAIWALAYRQLRSRK